MNRCLMLRNSWGWGGVGWDVLTSVAHEHMFDVAGTQVADSRWKQLQKWIPVTVKTMRRGKVNPELLKYIRSWQFRQTHARAEYLKILGQSLCHGWKENCGTAVEKHSSLQDTRFLELIVFLIKYNFLLKTKNSEGFDRQICIYKPYLLWSPLQIAMFHRQNKVKHVRGHWGALCPCCLFGVSGLGTFSVCFCFIVSGSAGTPFSFWLLVVGPLCWLDAGEMERKKNA